MNNEELVDRIRAGIDTADNMLVLWQQNTGFIKQKAHRYRFYAEFDDLMQEAYIALHNAVQKFNPDAGVKFITFLSYCLDTAMSRYISTQNTIRFPQVEDALIRKYNRTVNEICVSTGREPEREEIKTALGIGDKELDKIERNVCISHIASLDKSQLDDEECTLEELIPDDNNSIEQAENKMYLATMSETIWRVVDDLPREQSEVIHQRYDHGRQLKEIGEQTGQTWQKIAGIEGDALRALRSGKNGRTLRPFLYDELYNAALHGTSAERFSQTWTSSTERLAIDLAEPREKNP